MIYYLDTEFIEGFHKPMFGKRRHFIDLISIGIVAEDGREYYAISNEFDPKEASDWVKENVISKLETFNGMSGKSNKDIAHEIFNFINEPAIKKWDDGISFSDEIIKKAYENGETEVHALYGYYSDYDHVLLCSLFGTMMQLPKGFPMYTRDLKQMLDEVAEKKKWFYGRDIWSNTRMPGDRELQVGDIPASLQQKLEKIKRHDNYPQKNNEHNALADARWNKKLHDFITTQL